MASLIALRRSHQRLPFLRKSLVKSTATGFASTSRSLSSDSNGKIYELRTYNIVPKDYGRFLELSKEKIHLRFEVSKCLGYWCTDLGGLNEVTHIWEYDSFAQRAAVRKHLGGDANWQSEYFQKILPWLDKQENAVMYALPSCPVQEPSNSKSGIFELVTYRFKPGSFSQCSKAAEELLPLYSSIYKPVGLWYSDVGPLDTAYELIWYEDGDHRRRILAEVSKLSAQLETNESAQTWLRLMQSSSSKILNPAPFSPMQ